MLFFQFISVLVLVNLLSFGKSADPDDCEG